jgi:hypothetical protein
LAVTACSDESESGARASTEGSATFELVAPDGSKDALAINGPPGELEARFVETQNACRLALSASNPRQGDKTTAAKRARVVLELQLPANDALLEGKGGTVDVAAASPFAGDAMVRVEHGETAWWYSIAGGQVDVAPFELRVGAQVTFDIRAVPVKAGDGTNGTDRVVTGRATAKLQKRSVLSAGGCPAEAP